MTTRQLVLGASGLVGSALMRTIPSDASVQGTFKSHPGAGLLHLDLDDRRQVESAIELLRPDIVYLAAALTNVDYCETHPAESFTSLTGAMNVVPILQQTPAKLVFFSSDYVFDGAAGPYGEDDPLGPLNTYGRDKVFVEDYIAAHLRDYLIVRTTVLYGWGGAQNNYVCRVLGDLRAERSVRAPADEVGSPTFVPDLAAAAVALAKSDATGIYNAAGPVRASRYDLACWTARAFGMDPAAIEPVRSEDLNRPARRPLSAGLVSDKLSKRLDFVLRDFREGLMVMAAEEVR